MLPPITKVALGVRFGPLWEISDVLGSIVDEILRSSNSPFGPLTFPATQEGIRFHRLSNDKTNDYLQLTERDIVLSMAGRGDLDSVQQLAEQFNTHVLGAIRRHMTLRLVARYGLLLEFANCADHLKTTLMKHYLGEDSDARELVMRFTRRLPVEEAYFRKDVNDYRHLIYSFMQDQETANISFDYQQYFDPALDGEDARKKPFDQFARGAITYVSGSFEGWLKRFLKEEQVA